jgi:cation transport ATPase
VSFTDRLAKKYSNTFSLPSRNVLIAVLFLLGALVGTIVYTIEPSSKGPVFGLVDGLISLAFSSFVSAFIIHRLMKKGILTFKRTIAMADFSIAFLAIGLITAAVFSRIFNNPGSFERIYFISCGIIVAFIFIILSITSDLKQYELFINNTYSVDLFYLSRQFI